jgi:hypothetical protein
MGEVTFDKIFGQKLGKYQSSGKMAALLQTRQYEQDILLVRFPLVTGETEDLV